MQKNCKWTCSREENSNQSVIYIITFFWVSMTKCLLVKWRHYALNVHQLRVLIPVSLITLLCLHVSRATGVASPLGRPGFGSQGPNRDEGKAWGRGGEAELILAWATDFWEELDLSVPQPTPGPGHRRWSPQVHTVQNKQVALDIFSLVGLSLAIGQK